MKLQKENSTSTSWIIYLLAAFWMGTTRLQAAIYQPGLEIMNYYTKGHQRGARGHQVARKDHVGRPWACSKSDISMVNVFTLTNINTKIIKGKLKEIFILEVCIKLL